MRLLSRSAKWPVVFLVAAMAIAPLPTPAAADSLEAVRENFVAFHTGAGADPSNARWKASLASLEHEARVHMSPGHLRGDGSWADLDYSEIPGGNWSPWGHVRRLMTMAKAYRTPGHALYRDPSLRGAIEAAIAYVPVFYPATGDTPGNWWFWRIGIPLDLAPALVLMQGEISPPVFEAALRSLSSRIGPSPYYYPPATALKGQNLVWSSFTHLCLALLTNNETMMRSSRDAIASVSRQVSSGEGIQVDYSFHQHGAQLYTGGYGSSFAHDVGKFVLLTRATPFELPPASLAAAADYMVEGIAWGLHHNYFDVSLIGREVAKPWTSGYNGLAALLQMSEVPGARQTEIRAATAAMLRTWTHTLPTELAALASRFAGVSAAQPSGNRHYFKSDYTAHRRPHFFSSIKMFSSRTKSGERTNGENILGSRQSDGRFYLALAGDEFFGRDVWPTMDWSRLPGTTVERRPDAATDAYGFGSRSFTGGVSDGRNGVSAMHLTPIGSTLEARKAWLFLDDSIVFMTTGVTLLNGNRAETIVNQWPLSRPDAQLYVDGASMGAKLPWSGTLPAVLWAAADNVGYYFPERQTLEVSRENRSGAWSQLGSAVPDPTVHTKPVLTMWVDHGANVSNGSASYVIVPGVSGQQMADWAAARPVTILRNDAQVSAARDERTGDTGIVFWTAGAHENISASRASIVYMTRDRNVVRLHVSDPTHATTTIRLTMHGAWTLSEAPIGARTTLVNRSTMIDVPVTGGRTTTLVLKEPGRRRGVTRDPGASLTAALESD